MSDKVNVGFIIEQALGHITHGKNLQTNVSDDLEINAFWGFPKQPHSGLMALPGIRNWTLQAGLQAGQEIKGMHKNGRVIHSLFFHTQVTAILSGRWMKKIPSIVSLDATPLQYDSLGEFYEHSGGPSWLENYKFKLNQACYERASHLVTWSQWAKDSLVKDYGVADEKITVIPPGVNLDEWQLDDLDAKRINQNRPVNLLFVGGALKRKGGYDLIEAFSAAQEELPKDSVALHLVTKENLQKNIPRITVYNDMRPNSPELKDLYRKADIFCLPTYGDCLPMVLSEAAATALPVISTNVAAIPEIVQSEKSGLLIKPGDVQALKEAIVALVKKPNLRLEMGNHALGQTKNQYDAKANAKQLFNLLKRIAKKSP
ncbi:MAG: glycosyltransferase family 4 protein [Chloroflexota bacterium]